jgi:lipopolysaccharide export system ATP-binding protein
MEEIKLLLAQHLAKALGDYPAVNDVSLSVRRGEKVALLGPGGAGKTTVFRMIVGIVVPDYGRISLDGVDISDVPIYERAHRGLGYLPQEPSIFRTLTVEQNILIALEAHEPNLIRRSAIVEELLTTFGIRHVGKSRSGQISGGERRRCEIARAMVGHPSFVLLDEPFAGLDPIAISDMRIVINSLADRGIGILITDHNIREMLSFVDRAYVIQDGRILMEGSADAVISSPAVRRSYLGAGFSF